VLHYPQTEQKMETVAKRTKYACRTKGKGVANVTTARGNKLLQ